MNESFATGGDLGERLRAAAFRAKFGRDVRKDKQWLLARRIEGFKSDAESAIARRVLGERYFADEKAELERELLDAALSGKLADVAKELQSPQLGRVHLSQWNVVLAYEVVAMREGRLPTLKEIEAQLTRKRNTPRLEPRIIRDVLTRLGLTWSAGVKGRPAK